MKSWARLLGRWPIALGCVVVLAAAVLLPALGGSGLWEPHERQLADREAPRRTGTVAELVAIVQPAVLTETAPRPALPPGVPAPPPRTDPGCLHSAPYDAVARTLTERAIRWGGELDDSDAGRRLPLALLGLLTVLATAAIAMRTAGTRAGVVTALVLLAMPLMVLQSRQLTSEIGTAAGAALVLYGLVALHQVRGTWRGVLDALAAVAALVAGLALGFTGGGALLGVVVPLAAYGFAGLSSVPLVVDLVRIAHDAGLRVVRRLAPRRAIGRQAWGTSRRDWLAVLARLAAIAVICVLAYQLFDLREPQPGLVPPERAVLGHAIVSNGCWSSALGAIWRPEDDLRFIFDSTFEQIAYGTFPWGVLAPLAMGALIAGEDPGRRRLGLLALAWAAAAWIAAEAFQRKSGFTIYAGFPALALAIGPWLDGLFAERAPRDRGPALIAGTYAVLGVLVLGKDMQSFAEKLPSLLVGSGGVPYPAAAHLLHLPLKLWVLVLGMIVALAFALAIARISPRVTRGALAALLGGTVACAAFWAFGWQGELGEHLSSKPMFDTVSELAKPADTLVIMGDLGDAPHDYAPDLQPVHVTTREQVVAALEQPNRVFAIAPQSELCQLHHDLAHKPYFVIDDRDVRNFLMSNRIDGATDENPLLDKILHDPPKDIPNKPKSRIVWDNRIELLGWDIPKTVSRGSKLRVRLFYRVLQPIGGAWHVLLHVDGPLRANGDHLPIEDRCAMTLWSPGDYIVDTSTMVAGGPAFPKGQYEVWTGFFTGQTPNFKNMPVSEAPPQQRDQTDRVKITTITLD